MDVDTQPPVEVNAAPDSQAAPVVPTAGKVTGSVKWFNVTKGYGFITPDAGGEDLFVHQSAIMCDGFRSLREGEVVEFVVETSQDGRAKAVQVTGPGGSQPEGAPRRRMNNNGFGGGMGYGGGRGGGGAGYGGGYGAGYGAGAGYPPRGGFMAPPGAGYNQGGDFGGLPGGGPPAGFQGGPGFGGY